METLNLNLPRMYGDHHVLDVRRILTALPGVVDVYASSCFQIVEVRYDPAQLEPEGIEAALDRAGYLGDLEVPAETGVAANGSDSTYFRHSTAFEQTKQVVSFAQNVSYAGRPLWPCPGLGVLKKMEDDHG